MYIYFYTYNKFVLTVDWCPEPPQGEGVTVEVSGKRTGSTATYNCQPGFILFGQQVGQYKLKSLNITLSR